MSQAQSLVGEKLGSYKIESVVGSGAMGVVYRGTNEKTGRTAAVKVVSSEFAQGGKIRDRFEREAEILQQFRHPNIVRFLAVGRFRGTSYLAMEFIEGTTLEKIILDRGSLPWLEVVDLAIQMCAALHYAHQHGVVHRDLKPSNLMVTADGLMKLTDFGIAKDLDATALTGTGRTLGTAAYMAPEQIRGTPNVSHKTDLYALGVVLYQLLVGKPPFEGGTPVVLMHSHLNEPAPRPSARIQEIPKVLDELVVTLMAKSPGDRPWDAAAVGVKLTELREKVDRGASIAMVWPSNAPDRGKSGRTPAAAGAASSALAAEGPPRKKARKGGTLSLTGKDRTASGRVRAWFDRAVLENALLVAALIGIGGFIGYWVWPPSAAYLHRQAKTLMASSRHSDWVTARDDYMRELDDRFPNHPYQEEIRNWRDKILLDDAENRGKLLASGLNISLSKPANNAERQFMIANELAGGASNRGDDLTAIQQWQGLANQLEAKAKPQKPNDPEERQWYLLALKRVQELENAIKDRREYVAKQLGLAEAAFRAGRPNEAIAIRSKLVDQFAKYTDLADIFQPSANVPSPETKPEVATPAAPTPPGDANPPATPKTGSEPKEGGAPAERRDASTSRPHSSQSSTSPKDAPPEF